MHLLMALKCPSSLSLFFLGFYLESYYNLCHAIRFLSAGSGRECERGAGEGAPSLAGAVAPACASPLIPESQQPPRGTAEPGFVPAQDRPARRAASRSEAAQKYRPEG